MWPEPSQGDRILEVLLEGGTGSGGLPDWGSPRLKFWDGLCQLLVTLPESRAHLGESRVRGGERRVPTLLEYLDPAVPEGGHGTFPSHPPGCVLSGLSSLVCISVTSVQWSPEPHNVHREGPLWRGGLGRF